MYYSILQSSLSTSAEIGFQAVDKPHIRRKPRDSIKIAPSKPPSLRMYAELRLTRNMTAYVEAHVHMIFGIVVIYSAKQALYCNFDIKFLTYLTNKCLLVTLSRLDFPACELPCPGIGTVTAAGAEHFTIAQDSARNDIDMLRSLIPSSLFLFTLCCTQKESCQLLARITSLRDDLIDGFRDGQINMVLL